MNYWITRYDIIWYDLYNDKRNVVPIKVSVNLS